MIKTDTVPCTLRHLIYLGLCEPRVRHKVHGRPEERRVDSRFPDSKCTLRKYQTSDEERTGHRSPRASPLQ